LLLHHLKRDLHTLKKESKKKNPADYTKADGFAQGLLVIIGANTREISRMVIKAYL